MFTLLCVVYLLTRLLFITIFTFFNFLFVFLLYFFTFFELFDILFLFFIAVTFKRCFTKIINYTTQINNRIQIFKNSLFNNFLHDFNFFTFLRLKRFFKRVLNNIIIDTNNKLSKKFKNNKKRLTKSKNKFYVLKKSRVDFYVIFYFFTLFLFLYITF